MKGDNIPTNAFTFHAVPLIHHARAEPVLVEIEPRVGMDAEDLDRMTESGAKVLLMSYMRGHVPDMDR